MFVDERAYYQESRTTRPYNRAESPGPAARRIPTPNLNWIVQKKKDRLPGGADERDRAKFAKAQSYMVLVDNQAVCKNVRCRKRFDISGVKIDGLL